MRICATREAMSALGDSGALFDALDVVNPISIGDGMAQALPRQRNAFFSSSDAAFPDRDSASAQWDRVKAGTIGFEGGWRIYSSGPGIFTSLLIRCGFGRRRLWGTPAPAASHPGITMRWDLDQRDARAAQRLAQEFYADLRIFRPKGSFGR